VHIIKNAIEKGLWDKTWSRGRGKLTKQHFIDGYSAIFDPSRRGYLSGCLWRVGVSRSMFGLLAFDVHGKIVGLDAANAIRAPR
jgi:hypothetical protein